MIKPTSTVKAMQHRLIRPIKRYLASSLFAAWVALCGLPLGAQEKIAHSYLVLGAKTAIIAEDGSVAWEYSGGSRDGFVLPNGNVLLAFGNRVEEVTVDQQVVFRYTLDPSNKEIGTAERLYNGNTLVTELGPNPRLLEIAAPADAAQDSKVDGKIVSEIKLDPETDNAHMQTRMARQLRNGNYLVPHLLAFAVKEYTPDGHIVRTIRTDLEELGGRPAENWPFTAIRLDNGHTVLSLTHGNKVVEVDGSGSVVWKLTNADVNGLLKDPCGSQRLANGNTVVGSHAATTGISMIEVTPENKIVWSSDHPMAAGVHHFQILTTNGIKEPGRPAK